MKIRRIVIHNYRGIEERDINVAPSGAVAKGRNGGGKTTILRAVKAALLAQDVKADAIRKGAERAEILVDLGDVTVKRVITANTTTVAVEQGEFQVKKPQTYLTELLGTSSLDPMDLLTLRGKERLQKVLDALPVTVTVEQLRQWWPKCPDNYPCEGHGLEVIGRVRKAAYDKRTEANRVVKETAAEAARLTKEAAALATVAPAEAPDPADLEARADAAKAALGGLRARQEQAAAQGRKTEAQRVKINELRSRAATARLQMGERTPEPEMQSIALDIEAGEKRVEQARKALKDAETALETTKARKALADLRNDAFDRALSEADDLNIKADDIEATLAQAAVEPVSPEDIEAAVLTETQARAELEAARQALVAHGKAVAAGELAEKAQAVADEKRSEADRLDAIVKALTDDAPAALLASCDGIPGLTLDGEDVLYNGIRLDTLCGAEQVRVCVEIARRLNKKSGVLVVDGLERLDPDAMDLFVSEATRDGFQLLATRVDRGDIVIEALEPGPVSAEAAE